MHMLLLQFEITKNKRHEFDLALERLVKWPMYKLHAPGDANHELFQFVRQWNSETDMQADLGSHAFNNLIGLIKVLGHVEQSFIYRVGEQKEFLLEQY